MNSPEEQAGTLLIKNTAAANGAKLSPSGDAANSGQDSSFSKTRGSAGACPGLLDVPPSGLNSGPAATSLFFGALLLGALLAAGYFFFVGTSGGQY